jgi:hypothetical protein
VILSVCSAPGRLEDLTVDCNRRKLESNSIAKITKETMKMNKRLILILITIPVFCFSLFGLSSAEITQKYGSPNLSISDFVAVSSKQKGDTLTRTFKLTVNNTGEYPIANLKATLIHASDQATIQEGNVYVGSISPGESVTSADDFTYSVDRAKTDIIPEINLHWKLEYTDSSGQPVEDEVLLIER